MSSGATPRALGRPPSRVATEGVCAARTRRTRAPSRGPRAQAPRPSSAVLVPAACPGGGPRARATARKRGRDRAGGLPACRQARPPLPSPSGAVRPRAVCVSSPAPAPRSATPGARAVARGTRRGCAGSARDRAVRNARRTTTAGAGPGNERPKCRPVASWTASEVSAAGRCCVSCARVCACACAHPQRRDIRLAKL